MCWESVRGKESRGKWSVGDTEGFEKFTDEAQLLQFLGRGADRVRGLYEAVHDAILARFPRNRPANGLLGPRCCQSFRHLPAGARCVAGHSRLWCRTLARLTLSPID